jgi:hypothetical protein
MDSQYDGQSSEYTQYTQGESGQQQYTTDQDSESYPRMMSNQTSDISEMIDDSSSGSQYTYGYAQDYSQEYGQGDSGSAA